MDSSDFRKFLAARVSIREYGSGPVPEEDITYILDCASLAPSAGNREAWDVVVVADPELRWALMQAAYDQSHVENAGILFVVCSNYIRSMSRYGERGILYAVQDATIVCTYMMLAVHARNLAGCWTGAFDEDEIRGILDLPQHIRPVAILAVGSLSGNPVARTSRIPVKEHVHHDNW